MDLEVERYRSQAAPAYKVFSELNKLDKRLPAEHCLVDACHDTLL